MFVGSYGYGRLKWAYEICHSSALVTFTIIFGIRF